jgi:hypothetical protein
MEYTEILLGADMVTLEAMNVSRGLLSSYKFVDCWKSGVGVKCSRIEDGPRGQRWLQFSKGPQTWSKLGTRVYVFGSLRSFTKQTPSPHTSLSPFHFNTLLSISGISQDGTGTSTDDPQGSGSVVCVAHSTSSSQTDNVLRSATGFCCLSRLLWYDFVDGLLLALICIRSDLATLDLDWHPPSLRNRSSPVNTQETDCAENTRTSLIDAWNGSPDQRKRHFAYSFPEP